MNKPMSFLLCPYLMAMLLLCGCAAVEMHKNYRDDISAKEVMHTVEEDLEASDDLLWYSREDTSFYLGIPNDYLNDFSVAVQSNAHLIDEIGIFRSSSPEDAEYLEEYLQKYLLQTINGKRDFLKSYNPREIVKLENANTYRFGCYCVYTILSEDTNEVVLNKIEKMLTTD